MAAVVRIRPLPWWGSRFRATCAGTVVVAVLVLGASSWPSRFSVGLAGLWTAGVAGKVIRDLRQGIV